VEGFEPSRLDRVKHLHHAIGIKALDLK